MSKIVVVDYGMGNLWSVVSAARYLGKSAVLTSDPAEVGTADMIILPGVGSFRKAMQTLNSSGLSEAIVSATKGRGIPILGICLGMQLLGTRSTEGGITEGLGLVEKNVDRLEFTDPGSNKIPHIGFNSVVPDDRSGLFKGLPDNPNFYFVHSYRMLPGGISGKSAVCNYGTEFLAAFQQENIFATQFHPEKSQTNGLTVLRNFFEQ